MTLDASGGNQAEPGNLRGIFPQMLRFSYLGTRSTISSSRPSADTSRRVSSPPAVLCLAWGIHVLKLEVSDMLLELGGAAMPLLTAPGRFPALPAAAASPGIPNLSSCTWAGGDGE